MRLFALRIVLLSIAFTSLSAYARGPDLELRTLRAALAEGLAGRLSGVDYAEFLIELALEVGQERERRWSEAYGLDNLSSFLFRARGYETRLFAVEFLGDRSPSAHAARFVGRRAQAGHHFCEATDLKAFHLDFVSQEDAVAIGRALFEVAGVYRVMCNFVLAVDDETGKWRLQYLGIMNRLTPDIRYSRPVYFGDGRQDPGRVLETTDVPIDIDEVYGPQPGREAEDIWTLQPVRDSRDADPPEIE